MIFIVVPLLYLDNSQVSVYRTIGPTLVINCYLRKRQHGIPAADCDTHYVNMPMQYEPRSEKTGLRGFRPGSIQTRLYSHRRWLEA